MRTRAEGGWRCCDDGWGLGMMQFQRVKQAWTMPYNVKNSAMSIL